MKHCTLVFIFAFLATRAANAHSGLRSLRFPKAALQTTSPIENSLQAALKTFKWTVFLGDSVLGAQFLTMAQELGAKPDEPSLSEHRHCSEQGGAWPTYEAMIDLMDKPVEYLLLCGPSGCEFSRLGCMNFFGSVCMDDDDVCVGMCEGTAVWDAMIQQIQQTISKPGHYAASFHWAPSFFPTVNVYDRLGHFVPGAVLWNNCHHWIGHGQQVDEPVKLQYWLSYVDSSAQVLEKFVGLQSLAYQGCTRTLCEGGSRDQEKNSPEWLQQCKGRREWLEKANVAAQQLIVGRGQTFVDLNALLPDPVLRAAFLDGSHPCMPIPCMWHSATVHAPRQCCQSLLVHSLSSLGGMQGSGSWDVPTLVNTNTSLVNATGPGSIGNPPVNRLFEDVLGNLDEATPKETYFLNPVNQSQKRSRINL